MADAVLQDNHMEPASQGHKLPMIEVDNKKYPSSDTCKVARNQMKPAETGRCAT